MDVAVSPVARAAAPTGATHTRVVLLVTVHLAATVAIGRATLAAGAAIGPPVAIVVCATAFAVAGSFDLTLEFRRTRCTFTLGDAVLAASLFVLGPVGVALAAALGEVASLAAQRVAFLKLVFNLTNRLAAASAGAAIFFVTTSGSAGVGAWGAAVVAATAFSVLDIASTALVLSGIERVRFHDTFVRSAPTAAITTLATAPLGVLAVDLWHHSPLAPLLLAPTLLAVAVNTRSSTAHRDEHLRFERLYEASIRTAPLVDLDEVVIAIAAQARVLLTGTAGVCASRDHQGRWIGWVAGPDDARPLAPATVAALVASAGHRTAAEVPVGELGAPLAGLARVGDPVPMVAFAAAPRDQAAGTILAVVRADRVEGSRNRVQTLETFAAHAALVTSNARLLAERDAALAHQIDLNRQKSEFVAAVSHELRTPLAAMLGSVGTLRRLDGRLDRCERAEMLTATEAQGARLQRLIDELLVVAAAEHTGANLDSAPVALSTLLGEIVDDVRVVTGDRLQMDVATPEHVVTLDVAKVQRIVRNLLENAAKYAPLGPIELGAAVHGRDLVVIVRDHGPGIPEDARARAFEQFVQLDGSATRRQGGTGLGLYLGRQLARVLGGDLVLEHPSDGGCRFVLRVPAGAAVAPTPRSPRLGVRRRPSRVHTLA